jgi:hypothetical protein
LARDGGRALRPPFFADHTHARRSFVNRDGDGRGRLVLDDLLDELSSDDDLGWLISGSVARGEEHAYSDMDLTCFRREPPASYRERYSLRYWRGRLVSVMNRTVKSARADLESPSGALWAVEGLRQARILRDPTGALQRLQDQARAFDWALIRSAAQDWVSYRIMHAAEYVQKLLGTRHKGDEGAMANAAHVLAPRPLGQPLSGQRSGWPHLRPMQAPPPSGPRRQERCGSTPKRLP